MERRVFINYVGKFSVLASMGMISCSEENDPQPLPDLGGGIDIDLDSSPFDQLQEPGSWVLHPNRDVLLVNVDGEIRAYTSVCTHSGCNRSWSFTRNAGNATCTCHGSVFSTSGQVLQGPARANLARFQVVVDGNTVTVS